MSELKPEVGDVVRVERLFWGVDLQITEHTLEEFNFCLGFYEDDGPKVPSNFTPLSSLYDVHPEANENYWSHFGPYYDKYVRTFEIIKLEK